MNQLFCDYSLKFIPKNSSIINMSHLITDTLPLQVKPLIDFTQKHFIRPSYKKIFKTLTQANEASPQQKIIDRLCFKLLGKQFLKLDQENQQIYFSHKKNLRNKKKNTALNGSQIIQEIFTRQQDRTQEQKQRIKNKSHINVLRYLQKMPQKVNLHQKYNNTINQRINTIQQIQQVQRSKQNYRKWRNQTSNSPMKNPNFTKMTFLLQKLASDTKTLPNLDEGYIRNHQNLTRYTQKCESFGSNKGHKLNKSNKLNKLNKSYVPNVTLQPLTLKSNYYCRKSEQKQLQVRNSIIQTSGKR